MSELSCDTPFIGRNETDDLSLYWYVYAYSCRNASMCKIMHEGNHTPAASHKNQVNYT